MEATGIILAGGKSSRMGTNKALLEIGGKTVIERIVEEIQPVVNNIIIVNNSFESYEFLKLPMVKDMYQDVGPLAGIHAGLTASTTDRNLIVACDMPFVSAEIGAYLLEQLADYDGAVPVIFDRMHPLFSTYRRNVREVVERLIEEQKYRIAQILPNIHGKIVTEQELEKHGLRIEEYQFFNMNRPEEYENAKNMMKSNHEKGRDGS